MDFKTDSEFAMTSEQHLAKPNLTLNDPPALKLLLYPDELTIYLLPTDAKIPAGIFSLKWFTISKTLDELSIIIPSSILKVFKKSKVKSESGWRCLKIDAVLDFSLVGILASIVNPLKEAKIPVFVVSTFDTDYILVKEQHVENARVAIVQATGYSIVDSELSLV